MKKSKIFLFVCLAFISGVAIRSYFFMPPFLIYLIFLSGAAVLILGWKSVKFRVFGFCLFILILGIWRFQISVPETGEDKIWFYEQKEIVFKGIVSREPDVRSDYLKLTVDSREAYIDKNWRKISGQVLVRADLYPSYVYGDELKIHCHLKRPEEFNGFKYDEYLARYGVYALCYYPEINLLSRNNGLKLFQSILRIKENLAAAVKSSLPEPEAGFFNALFLGLRSDVSPAITDSFSVAGLSHIIAISGSHIVIFVSILSALAATLFISRQKAFYPILIILGLFVVSTGMSASAVRAGIMGFLVLWAQKIGRLNWSLNAVIFTATLMLLANPLILKTDVGFQLSFLAVLGLIYFLPLLEEWLKKIPNWKRFELRSYLTITLSATLATAPLVAYQFNYFSLVSLFANIAVAMILPFLMSWGFLVLLLGIWFIPLAKILFFPVWLMLKYIIWIAEFFSALPLAAVKWQDVSWLAALAVYLGMIILTFLAYKYKNKVADSLQKKNEN